VGAYVIDLPLDAAQRRDVLQLLREADWLDAGTR
jgi:hypothetical protein